MNRLALMTGVLSLTLAGVAAHAQTPTAQTQPGYQPKYDQGQSQPGSQRTVPGSTYEATQQRSMTQPGAQPKLYQHQDQPSAVTTAPAPASGLGAVGPATGLTKDYSSAPSQAQPAYQRRATFQPSSASTPGATAGDMTTQIQQELTMAGYNPGPIDGIAGPRTAQAIRAYQADNGLLQDGAASPTLLNHMRSKHMQSSSAAGQAQSQPQVQSPPPVQPRQSQTQPQVQPSAHTQSPPSDSSAQQSAGFFSGWFQRMDDEAPQDLQRVQSGYQPKFYREPTSSHESHGPGITYPYEERPVAGRGQPVPPPQPAQPDTGDAAAMSQISPAAGGGDSAGKDGSTSRLMTEIQKCRQIGDPASRASCESQARKTWSQ